MKKLLTLIAACLLAGGFAASAFAANGSEEISTAHAHALMAQGSNTLAMAHTHLHHVINCLVGTHGAGYDAAAGMPCKGEGNGAIADSAGNQTLDAKLKSALADAQDGLKIDNLAAVQKTAAKVAAALQTTPVQKAAGGYSW
ncbi:MAG: hypothetical protein ACRETQ_05065 [Gammaproteobacteria bacterium]